MQDLKEQLSKLEQRRELFPAIEVLGKLLEVEPDNDEYKLRLAKFLVDTGQIERAERLLRTALESGSEDLRFQLNLGHVLKALGRSE